MKFISIFNDVLGPVMRGPSSSHTAGSYRIGRICRSLLGEAPSQVTFTFDPSGSYAQVYKQQGADLSLAAGLMEWPITDERFPKALQIASELKIEINFKISPIPGSDHPNTVVVDMTTPNGEKFSIEARSTGGGAVLFTRLNDWPVRLDGKTYDYYIECDESVESQVKSIFIACEQSYKKPERQREGSRTLVCFHSPCELIPELESRIKQIPGVKAFWACHPVFYVQKGQLLFASAEKMVEISEERDISLGKTGLEYESALLGLSKAEVLNEMIRRFEVMSSSVDQGFQDENIHMQLLSPSAGKVLNAEKKGKVPVGGIHTRAAARALAVMHVNSSMGIVCAAPTGGSAGVIPGVLVTMAEEKGLRPEKIALALLSAAAIGLIVAHRATFAAESAGCQVEIGAAGAMAAAAVVEIAGGSARQAVDAAAISLQNTMGSVCDLVQGMCEIPCHTRNAVAASSAFVCADLILGGYQNPVPLDETIDAVLASGKMLPPELRCTALGGLAQTPSAKSLPRQR